MKNIFAYIILIFALIFVFFDKDLLFTPAVEPEVVFEIKPTNLEIHNEVRDFFVLTSESIISKDMEEIYIDKIAKEYYGKTLNVNDFYSDLVYYLEIIHLYRKYCFLKKQLTKDDIYNFRSNFLELSLNGEIPNTDEKILNIFAKVFSKFNLYEIRKYLNHYLKTQYDNLNSEEKIFFTRIYSLFIHPDEKNFNLRFYHLKHDKINLNGLSGNFIVFFGETLIQTNLLKKYLEYYNFSLLRFAQTSFGNIFPFYIKIEYLVNYMYYDYEYFNGANSQKLKSKLIEFDKYFDKHSNAIETFYALINVASVYQRFDEADIMLTYYEDALSYIETFPKIKNSYFFHQSLLILFSDYVKNNDIYYSKELLERLYKYGIDKKFFNGQNRLSYSFLQNEIILKIGQSEFDEALFKVNDLISKVEKLNLPNNKKITQLQIIKAFIYFNQQDFYKSTQLFEAIIQNKDTLEKDRINSYINLIMGYILLGENEQAKTAYFELSKLIKNNPYRFNLTQIIQGLKEKIK